MNTWSTTRWTTHSQFSNPKSQSKARSTTSPKMSSRRRRVFLLNQRVRPPVKFPYLCSSFRDTSKVVPPSLLLSQKNRHQNSCLLLLNSRKTNHKKRARSQLPRKVIPSVARLRLTQSHLQLTMMILRRTLFKMWKTSTCNRIRPATESEPVVAPVQSLELTRALTL